MFIGCEDELNKCYESGKAELFVKSVMIGAERG